MKRVECAYSQEIHSPVLQKNKCLQARQRRLELCLRETGGRARSAHVYHMCSKILSEASYTKNCYTKPVNADNHVDETSFLVELNAQGTKMSKEVRMEKVFYNGSTIVQQISLVAIFLSTSKYAFLVDRYVLMHCRAFGFVNRIAIESTMLFPYICVLEQTMSYLDLFFFKLLLPCFCLVLSFFQKSTNFGVFCDYFNWLCIISEPVRSIEHK